MKIERNGQPERIKPAEDCDYKPTAACARPILVGTQAPPLRQCAGGAPPCRLMRMARAAGAVLHRRELLRLRGEGAAVTARVGIMRGVGLRGAPARGAEEVAAGVVVERVGRAHFVRQRAEAE